MDNLVYAAIVPHPPIIVPGVGDREGALATCRAMEEWAETVKGLEPETIVIVSPHGTIFRDAITYNGQPTTEGNLQQFGSNVRLSYGCDLELLEAIREMAERYKVPVAELTPELAGRTGANLGLDHGDLVPLYFLDQAGVRCQLVQVTVGMLPREELYAFGLAVQRAARLVSRRVVMVASGDLSHRLTPDAPAGYNPEGQRFDTLLVQELKELQVEQVLQIDENLAEKAGECGLRPVIMMLGALDGYEGSTKVFSYEGPFGVGYLVAGIRPGSLSPERELLTKLLDQKESAVQERRKRESLPVRIARQALESYLKEGSLPPRKDHEYQQQAMAEMDNPGILEGRAGVFVSIKKNGELRGCIGTTAPTQQDIIGEIRENAISAGTRDPRFWEVETEELSQLVYSVDILKPPEPISGIGQLDVKKYGVIVRSKGKSGLLLPNLEGVDTVEEQVEIAKQKAGIRTGEEVSLERFEVIRFH